MIMRADKILSYAELCKLRISLLSAFSAGMGFLLSAHRVGSEMLSVAFGVFLLACGACALNQFQERGLDAMMKRTSGRPVPSGRIKPASALCFALSLISLGCLILLLIGGAVVMFLGVIAVIWYNGVYTFLKRKTAFAAVPGSLTGSVPPAIGWVLGGGALTDHRLATICFFFFMWQAPHFWLLLMGHGEEYEKAGLPSPAALFSRPQLRRVIFIWISAAAISVLFIPMGGVVQNYLTGISLFTASVWLIFRGVRVLRAGDRDDCFILAFRGINVFVFIIMLLLSIDNLIGGFTL